MVIPTTESGREIVPDSRVLDVVCVCVEVELLELTQEGVRSARGYNTYMVQFQYGWVSLWPHFSTREFAKNLTYCLCYGRKS